MNRGPNVNSTLRWCALAVITGLCVASVGCGQKGALYLPDRNGSVVTRPANAPQPQQQAPATPAPQSPAGTPKKDKDAPN